jgi:hypothetical protein
MPRFNRLPPESRRWLLWIGIGVLLRLLFVLFPRPVDDDTWDYLELGHNLLHHGIYGMDAGADVSPSLFRLPAYPLLLATCEQLFARLWPVAWVNAVFVLQLIADVAGGMLLASFARRHLSPRAAEIALALAMLCPFTAAYAAIAMTECLSVFAVALGVYAAGRALAAERDGKRDIGALLLAGSASALAMLLRPDGALLCAALAAGLFGYTVQMRAALQRGPRGIVSGLSATAIFGLAALLPLAPWTLRNWTEFHVFQPLAPRHLNDPGERYNAGFYRWLRTWSMEYVTTANVFWSIGSDPIDLADLPPRVFDTPAQREQTLRLIAEYNLHNSISPELDDRFAALAAERIHAHPLRYYVVLPVLRVADMALRPQTAVFYLDVFWWRWREHPGQTSWAILLGLINLAYVVAAVWGFLSRRVPWAWMLGGYLLLRCLLLATMENPEPRYMLECFPIFIVAAAAALQGVKKLPRLSETAAEPQASRS